MTEEIKCNTCGNLHAGTECPHCPKKVRIGMNEDRIRELLADGIYKNVGSAMREQMSNAMSHGCMAFHEKYLYTDEIYVEVNMDYGTRTVKVRDNGMGMTKYHFENIYMSYGNSGVSDKEVNERAGQFGMGTMSFNMIADSAIVESFHRESGEHISYLIKDENWMENLEGNKVMSGGKTDYDNNVFGDYGTLITINLKENVDMDELAEMVKSMGSNYPVRTVLHTVNSEMKQDDSATHGSNDDAVFEYPPIMKFEDYVKKLCAAEGVERMVDNPEWKQFDDKGKEYVIDEQGSMITVNEDDEEIRIPRRIKVNQPKNYEKIVDTDFMEAYVTDLDEVKGRHGNWNPNQFEFYLCRVPIDIELSGSLNKSGVGQPGFEKYNLRILINVKEEKYQGTNRNGNTSLIRVPKMDRDSVSQVADEHITKILCDTVLPYISSVAHYTSMSDCIEKPLHWIEKRYVMNLAGKELYDEETLQFKNRLSRIVVRKRTTSGLQKIKRNDHGANMWDLVHKKSGRSYEHFFYHKTLNSAAYSGLIHYLKEIEGIEPDTVCMVGETQKQKNFPQNYRETFANGGMLVNPVITEHNTEEYGDRVHNWDGLDVIDLKEYKKTHKFTSTSSRGSYDSGAKVWDVTLNGRSFPYTESALLTHHMKPENVYWAGDIIDHKGIRKVTLTSHWYGHVPIGHFSKNADETLTVTGNKVGLIVAKRYPKGTPHISELFDQVDEMIDTEEIYLWNPCSNKKIPWSEVPKGSNGEKDIRRIKIDYIDPVTDEVIAANDLEEYARLPPLRLFSAEQAPALKTNYSALLKLPDGGSKMTDATYRKEIPIIVMFCPRQMMCATELYFNLKEDIEGRNYFVSMNPTTKKFEGREYKNETWDFDENVVLGNINQEQSVIINSFRKNPQWISATDWEEYWNDFTSGEEFDNHFTKPIKREFYNETGSNGELLKDFQLLLDLPEIQDIGRHVLSGDVDALMSIMNGVEVVKNGYDNDVITHVDLKWKSCSVLWGDLVHKDITDMFVKRWNRISEAIYESLYHFHPDTKIRVLQLKEGFDDSNSKIINLDLWVRHDAKGKRPNHYLTRNIKEIMMGENHWEISDNIHPLKSENVEIKEIDGKQYVMLPFTMERRYGDNSVKIINEYEWVETGEGVKTKITKPVIYQRWSDYNRS